MTLTGPQLKLLRSLDGETGTIINTTQLRTAKVLWNLGLVEFAMSNTGSKYGEVATGYKLTHRGLRVVLDRENYERTANRIDGYDRDDLGESPDY